jgi:hypothetical protein
MDVVVDKFACPAEFTEVDGLLGLKLIEGVGGGIVIDAPVLGGCSSKGKAEFICSWIIKVNEEL